MDTDIDAGVSPTFHPDNFAEGTEVHGVVKSIYDSLTKHHEAVAALKADPTLTPDARLVEVLKLRESLVSKTLPKLDATNQKLAAREESHLKTLEHRATHFGSTPTIQGWEVRSAIAELPESERLGFIRKLARDGDREALNAIGHRPWALGLRMSATEWAAFREEVFGIAEPEAAKTLEATRQARVRFGALAEAFWRQYAMKSHDPKAAAARVAAEKRREAVAAARS